MLEYLLSADWCGYSHPLVLRQRTERRKLLAIDPRKDIGYALFLIEDRSLYRRTIGKDKEGKEFLLLKHERDPICLPAPVIALTSDSDLPSFLLADGTQWKQVDYRKRVPSNNLLPLTAFTQLLSSVDSRPILSFQQQLKIIDSYFEPVLC